MIGFLASSRGMLARPSGSRVDPLPYSLDLLAGKKGFDRGHPPLAQTGHIAVEKAIGAIARDDRCHPGASAAENALPAVQAKLALLHLLAVARVAALLEDRLDIAGKIASLSKRQTRRECGGAQGS